MSSFAKWENGSTHLKDVRRPPWIMHMKLSAVLGGGGHQLAVKAVPFGSHTECSVSLTLS